jgi:DNA sulfur modification protein DndD
VILLSTDEEIDETHLTSLRSRIGHSYTLVHDESLDGTVITPGYQFAEQP